MYFVLPDFFDPEVVIEWAAFETILVVAVFDGDGDFFDICFALDFFDGDLFGIDGFWAIAVGTTSVGL